MENRELILQLAARVAAHSIYSEQLLHSVVLNGFIYLFGTLCEWLRSAELYAADLCCSPQHPFFQKREQTRKL
jgi:hypothetical protein